MYDDEMTATLYSMDIEQAILGGLLGKTSLFQHAAGWLDPLHFYFTPHQIIFQAMKELFAGNCPINVVSITTHLREQERLSEARGTSYIMDLAMSGAGLDVEIGGEFTLRYHGKKLIDLAKRRETVRSAEEIAESAFDLSKNDYAETAQAILMTLTDAYQLQEVASTSSTVDEALRAIHDELTVTGGVTGLSTGFRSLDKITRGFQPYQLITLAARPGGGKSAFAVNIAGHVAMNEKKPVLFISLEMKSLELMKRLIKCVSETQADAVRLQTAAQQIKHYSRNLLLDDDAGQTLTTIQSKILKAKQAHPDLGLIIVDHIGLIQPEPNARKNTPRAYEIQEITSRFKVLAKTVQTPILQLAQMNRAIEGRANNEPILSDLRDSGSIEMDSDIVLFTTIIREEDRRLTGEAFLTIAKQRDGAQAKIPLIFKPFLTQFKESERAHAVI